MRDDKSHNNGQSGFLKSRYFKDIFGQASLVMVAQFIPIAFSPFLSRIYDENAMAEITGLMAFSSLLLVFSTFKLENAIVIAKTNEEARQILSLSAIISICFVFLTVLMVFFFSAEIVKGFEVQNVVYLIPGYILFFSISNILNFWFVRIKKFKMKAYSKIIENTSYVIFAITLYYLVGKNDIGLALGKIIGVISALFVLLLVSKLKWKKYSLKSYLDLLIAHKEFPLHYVPSSFVNVISLQILVLFIGIYFTKEQLGYFGLANMVILLPISFITQSVGSIFFQKTSEHMNLGNRKEAKKVFYQTLKMLFAIGLPAFLVLYFGSRYLFPIVFGTNWEVTGTIAESLSIVFLSQIIVGPISIILISLGKLKLNALWQYGRFAIMAIYMLCLIYFYKLDFLQFIKWYAYGSALLYVIYFLIINNEVRKLDKDLISPLN